MSTSQLTTIMEEIVGTHLPKLSTELQSAKRLARNAATKESLEALTSSFNTVAGKVASIEQQLGASTDSETVLSNAAAIIEIRGLVTQLRTDVDKAIADIVANDSKHESDVSTINSTITTIQGDIEEHSGRITENTNDIATQLGMINSHGDSITNINGEISSIKTQLGDASSSHASDITRIDQAIEQINDFIGVNRELDESQAESLVALQASINANAAKITEQTTAMDTLKTAFATINTQLEAVDAETETPEEEDQTNVRISTLETTVATLQTDVAAVQRQSETVSSLNTQVAEVKSHITTVPHLNTTHKAVLERDEEGTPVREVEKTYKEWIQQYAEKSETSCLDEKLTVMSGTPEVTAREAIQNCAANFTQVKETVDANKALILDPTHPSIDAGIDARNLFVVPAEEEYKTIPSTIVYIDATKKVIVGKRIVTTNYDAMDITFEIPSETNIDHTKPIQLYINIKDIPAVEGSKQSQVVVRNNYSMTLVVSDIFLVTDSREDGDNFFTIKLYGIEPATEFSQHMNNNNLSVSTLMYSKLSGETESAFETAGPTSFKFVIHCIEMTKGTPAESVQLKIDRTAPLIYNFENRIDITESSFTIEKVKA